MQICRPHEWEAHFISENHELVKTKAKQVERKHMYYGELCGKNGKEEADWMIENGKVEEEEEGDSDGDICYIKKSK